MTVILNVVTAFDGGSCQITDHGYSCSYKDGDVTLFNDGVDGCLNNYGPFITSPDDFLASYDPEVSGGCYNAFGNGNVFAS